MKAIVSFCFISPCKVRLLSRFYHYRRREWLVEARVTSRTHKFFSMGEIITVEAQSLHLRQGVIKGSCGRLYFEGVPDFMSLPLKTAGKNNV